VRSGCLVFLGWLISICYLIDVDHGLQLHAIIGIEFIVQLGLALLHILRLVMLDHLAHLLERLALLVVRLSRKFNIISDLIAGGLDGHLLDLFLAVGKASLCLRVHDGGHSDRDGYQDPEHTSDQDPDPVRCFSLIALMEV